LGLGLREVETEVELEDEEELEGEEGRPPGPPGGIIALEANSAIRDGPRGVIVGVCEVRGGVEGVGDRRVERTAGSCSDLGLEQFAQIPFLKACSLKFLQPEYVGEDGVVGLVVEAVGVEGTRTDNADGVSKETPLGFPAISPKN